MGHPPPLLPPASSASRGASQAHRPRPMAGLRGALRAGLRPACPHNPAGGCPVSRTWRWDVTELTQAWGEEGKFSLKHTSVRSGIRWQGRGTGGGRGPGPGVSVPCASHAGCGRLGGGCGRAEGGRSAEPNAGSPGRAEGCAARRTRCSAPAPASSAVPGRAWESHTLCCTSRPCPQGGDRAQSAERRCQGLCALLQEVCQSWATASPWTRPSVWEGRRPAPAGLGTKAHDCVQGETVGNTQALRTRRTRNLFIAKRHFPRPGRGREGRACPRGLHQETQGGMPRTHPPRGAGLRGGRGRGARPWQRPNQQGRVVSDGRRQISWGLFFSLGSNFMENFLFFK